MNLISTLLTIIIDLPFYIENYVHRLTFVFSMYFLLLFYGFFSDKKKITPKRYFDGEKHTGNLIHKFSYLQNLKNGVKFHYVTNIYSQETKTDQPVVVFLHGILESWYSWHSQLELLDKQNIPCIAIDFKNHGNSSAHYAGSDIYELDLGKNFDLTYQGKEITELLNMLNIENVIFVTTDLGSLVCDRLVNQFYCKKTHGWIRCHETMPMYPNDKGLPQKYLFWFNINLSLFLMHFSNEMILRLFYKATGWKSCNSFSATHFAINDEETEKCLENAICPFTYGPYLGHNSNYMSWAGAYMYAFQNDIYTAAVLNCNAYKSCKFPVVVLAGLHDGSCLINFVNGATSLGYKFVNDKFCSKMISYNGQYGYKFIYDDDSKEISSDRSIKANEYFCNSPSAKLETINAGHMSHLENTKEFNKILNDFINGKISSDD